VLALVEIDLHLIAERRGQADAHAATVADARALELAVGLVGHEDGGVHQLVGGKAADLGLAGAVEIGHHPAQRELAGQALRAAIFLGGGGVAGLALARGDADEQRAPDAEEHGLDHAALEGADADVGEAAAAGAGHGRGDVGVDGAVDAERMPPSDSPQVP
jgi:hypothetical protein